MCEDKLTYSKELMNKVNDDFFDLIKIIDAFNGNEDQPINRNDLLKFEIGKWYDLSPKVRIRRKQNRFKTYLNFDTEMDEGGEFGKHFHEDLIESCEILSGSMIDKNDNKKYREGDVLHYEKGQMHTPVSTSKTKLHVLFKA